MRCAFFALESVERATAELLFNAINKHFQESITLLYDNLVGIGKTRKTILVIPHGNADTKRLFSLIGLNKTKHRNTLGISTLNSLLTVQFNVPTKSYEFKPNTELL